MNNFNRLKSSANALAILKSGLFGIAAGLFTFGGTLLVTKLVAAEFALVYIALIAAGVAVAVTTGLILTLRLGNMRFAKLLDNENHLDEKVQTMVAFANDTSDMLTLQREDTESILASVRPKKSPIKQLMMPIVSLLVSAALLMPAFFVTADKPEEDGETPTYVEPFKISSWQLGALTTLIEDVESSSAYEEVKTDTAKELNRLLRVLKNTSVKDLMYSEVIASIVAIDLIAENAHTYKALCVALYAANPTSVKSLARQVLNVNGLAFGEWMGEFRELYRGDTVKLPEQEPAPPEENGGEPENTKAADEPIVLETLEEKILALASGIKETLSPVEGYEDDALYISLLAFANEMEATLAIEDEVIRQTAIDKAFANASTDISAALSAQYRNKALRDTVIKQLISIFKIPEYMIPPLLGDQLPTLEDSSGSGDDEENDNGATGGYGEGNNLYGSNDLIFDPNAKDGPAYVVYGDSFDFYYKSIESLLLYGNLSDETKSILIDYFRKLSDGRGQN